MQGEYLDFAEVVRRVPELVQCYEPHAEAHYNYGDPHDPVKCSFSPPRAAVVPKNRHTESARAS
jgi:hypothetical protein